MAKKSKAPPAATRLAASKRSTAPRAPVVAVIMGSDSDLRIMKDAVKQLAELGIAHEVRIVSAHRTPAFMIEYATGAEARGIEIIIAAAGGAAHLPGMVAACTRLPVIGVPITVGRLKGLDALLSITQMPRGVPVATMAIEGAANGALFAARILALRDPTLRKRLERVATAHMHKVRDANRALASAGRRR